MKYAKSNKADKLVEKDMSFICETTIAPWNRNDLDLFLVEHGVTDYAVTYDDSAMVIRFTNEEDAVWFKLTSFEQENTPQINKTAISARTRLLSASWTMDGVEDLKCDLQFDKGVIEEMAAQIANELDDDIMDSMTQEFTPNGKKT